MDRAISPDLRPGRRPERDRLFSAKKTARALAVGCGFALAFGWVWSGALRNLLFSDILTGSLFSGQGTSIFFAVLMAVFLLVGITKFTPGIASSGPGAAGPPAWLFPLVAHGAALLPLGVLYILPGPEGPPVLAASLGLAGGLAGLFWGAALLRLSPADAGLALAAGWLGITGLAPLSALIVARLAECLPMGGLPLAPLAILSGCALAALWVVRLLASRLMPPECSGGDMPPPAQLPGNRAAAMFLAVAALGMLFSADKYAAPPVLAQCALEADGAFLALAIFRVPQGQGNGNDAQRARLFAALSLVLPLALPLALLPLAALWMPSFSWSLHLATGMLLTVSLMNLAGPSRTKGRAPGFGGCSLAGCSLAALLLALNSGFYAGTRAAFWERDNAGLAALLCACLAALFVLSRFDFRRLTGESGAARRNAFPGTKPVTAVASLIAAGARLLLGNAALRTKRAQERRALPNTGVPADKPSIDAAPDVAAERNEAPGPAEEPAQTPTQTPVQTPVQTPTQTPGDSTMKLTPTEQRIAALLRQGYNNTAISETLNIAQATTRVHLRSIHKKMRTLSREDLVERLREMAEGNPSA